MGLTPGYWLRRQSPVKLLQFFDLVVLPIFNVEYLGLRRLDAEVYSRSGPAFPLRPKVIPFRSPRIQISQCIMCRFDSGHGLGISLVTLPKQPGNLAVNAAVPKEDVADGVQLVTEGQEERVVCTAGGGAKILFWDTGRWGCFGVARRNLAAFRNKPPRGAEKVNSLDHSQ